MPVLPAVGITSYGAFVFGPETETIGMSVVPIESSDGRTSIANRYTIRIRTILAEGAVVPGYNAEQDMPDVRKILTTYGLNFVYEGKGIGAINVNAVALFSGDLMFGPKPKELSWRPLGPTAGELIWQVEFILSDCNRTSPFFRIMEFSWEADYTIDRYRLTRRDIKGTIRIPSRVIGAKPTDSVDRYYEQIAPPIPYQFRRENEHRNIDRTKSVMTFDFSDVLMESPLPSGCLEATVKIKHSNQPYLFNNWTMTISATYKMAQHIPLQWSFFYFAELLKDRIAAAAVGIAGGEARLRGILNIEDAVAIRPVPVQSKAQKVFPVSFEIEESPQTREMSYSASFVLTFPIPVLMLHGMWRPLPGHNFQLWALSMQPANRPRGYTQERLKSTDDVVINLCGPEGQFQLPTATIPSRDGPFNLAESLGISCPTIQESWVVYRNFLTIVQDNKVIYHNPLPKKPIAPSFTLPPQPSSGWTPGPNDAGKPEEAPVIQQTSKPTLEVILTGHAIRVCWDINQPSLVSAGGKEAILANRDGIEYFVSGVVANYGVPVYAAKWRQRWILRDYPTTNVKQSDSGGTSTMKGVENNWVPQPSDGPLQNGP